MGSVVTCSDYSDKQMNVIITWFNVTIGTDYEEFGDEDDNSEATYGVTFFDVAPYEVRMIIEFEEQFRKHLSLNHSKQYK